MEQRKPLDDLKIRISGLSNGLHEYRFCSDPSEVGLGENFTVPVEVDAVLDKTATQLYLIASIRTSGLFSCDRCVEKFAQSIAGSYAVFYVYNEPEPGKHDLEEVQLISTDTVHLDLWEDVRQMTMLSVPLKLLCREDCKGLCPQCGTNWNERPCTCKDGYGDPRWERLQSLLHK
ncbi:MAG TPA: DUF177 domain-containing protein [Bacteroidota bacterium]|nr:DUF177 domain-containing protein [Bacteroidota bacterium]